MGKSRELNEFERGKIIGLRIAGRTHEAIARLLKIPKSTVTDTITRHANSNNGSSATVLQEEWRKIPSETYTKLIESMPHRIEACIKNQGWPTKY